MSDNITVEEFENLEGKVISAAKNDPSGYYKVGDIKVTFRRPKLFSKYKGRVWANEKLKEIGIVNPDEEEPGLVFYYRFIGALCMNVASIILPNGKPLTLNEDEDYTFLLEKYLEEELNAKGINEEPFIDELSTVFTTWDKDSTPTEEELKKS